MLGCIMFIAFFDTKAQNIINGDVQIEKNYDPIILGEDDDNIYVINNKKKMAIEAFSKSNKLNRKYSEPFENPKIDNKKTELEAFKFVGDKIIFSYSYFDKKSDIYTIFAKVFDTKSGKFLDKKIDLVNADVEKKKRKGNFEVLISKDNSKIFIYHQAYYKAKKKYIRKYFLYDNNFKKLFEKQLESDELVENSFLIDNDGSIYYTRWDNGLFIGSYDANKDYEFWEQKATFEMPKVQEYKLTNFNIRINTKNELVVAGLVKAKKGTGLFKNVFQVYGGFYSTVDSESKEVKVAKISAFSESTINQFKTASQIKKNKEPNLFKEFEITKSYHRADGGIVITMEEFERSIFYDQKGRVSKEVVTYGDILAINFDPNGNLTWGHLIPKKQLFRYTRFGIFYTSTVGVKFFLPPWEWKTTRYFSHTCIFKDDKVQVTYLETPKTINNLLDNQKPKATKKPARSLVCKYEIDLKTGERNKSANTELFNSGLIICPSKTYQANQNSNIILFGVNKKNYNFVIIPQGK